MWPTTNGLRKLSGDEAALVRGAIAMMVDQLVAEGREESTQHQYFISWFDNWEYSQRLWLLDQVSTALLTESKPPEAAAMLEATVDAVFAEISDLIQIEIDSNDTAERKSWRQSTIEAFVYQNGRHPKIRPDDTDVSAWHTLVTQLADAILGVRIYQQAEAFRDGDPSQTARFLLQKGVSANFLSAIPPLLSVDQTQLAIDRIQRLVCAT